jgi:hypothetical protein
LLRDGRGLLAVLPVARLPIGPLPARCSRLTISAMRASRSSSLSPRSTLRGAPVRAGGRLAISAQSTRRNNTRAGWLRRKHAWGESHANRSSGPPSERSLHDAMAEGATPWDERGGATEELMRLPLLFVSTLALLPTLVAPGESILPTRASTGNGELNGTYLCEGVRPDGAPYKGTVRIVRHNGAYQVIWNVGRAEQYVGIGILTGDVLAVSYFGGSPGVVAYRIEQNEKGARLVGQWTVASARGHVFGETLTRLTQDVTAVPAPAPEPRRERIAPSGRLKAT